jgi:hypothetical protein
MYVSCTVPRFLFVPVVILSMFAGVASGQDYAAVYQARLSEQDHFSSKGAKLTSVAAILRQDRANYHKFGKRDFDDQPDGFFTSAGNRGLLEKYYNNVASSSPLSKEDQNIILNRTPLVNVSLVDGVGTKYLSVKILDRGRPRAGAGAGSVGNAGQLVRPKPGNPLRKAVLDGLRGPIQKDLGQKVIFIVDDIRVVGDWAYAQVNPVQPNSKPIDFSKTRYKEALEEGYFDGPRTYALLRKQGGHWVTVTYQIGPTDVCWLGWSEAPYNAPPRVLPSGGN